MHVISTREITGQNRSAAFQWKECPINWWIGRKQRAPLSLSCEWLKKGSYLFSYHPLMADLHLLLKSNLHEPNLPTMDLGDHKFTRAHGKWTDTRCGCWYQPTLLITPSMGQYREEVGGPYNLMSSGLCSNMAKPFAWSVSPLFTLPTSILIPSRRASFVAGEKTWVAWPVKQCSIFICSFTFSVHVFTVVSSFYKS